MASVCCSNILARLLPIQKKESGTLSLLGERRRRRRRITRKKTI